MDTIKNTANYVSDKVQCTSAPFLVSFIRH